MSSDDNMSDVDNSIINNNVANQINNPYIYIDILAKLNTLVEDLSNNIEEFKILFKDLITKGLYLKNINFELKIDDHVLIYDFTSYDFIYKNIKWENYICDVIEKISITNFNILLLDVLKNENKYDSIYHNSNYNINGIISEIMTDVKYDKITVYLNCELKKISQIYTRIPNLNNTVEQDKDMVISFFHADHINKKNIEKSLELYEEYEKKYIYYKYCITAYVDLKKALYIKNIVFNNKPCDIKNNLTTSHNLKALHNIDNNVRYGDYNYRCMFNFIETIFMNFINKKLFSKNNKKEDNITNKLKYNIWKNINLDRYDQLHDIDNKTTSYPYHYTLYNLIRKIDMQVDYIESLLSKSTNLSDFDPTNFFSLLNQFRDEFILLTKNAFNTYGTFMYKKQIYIDFYINKFILKFNIIKSNYYIKIITKFKKENLIIDYYNNFKHDQDFIKNYFPINYFDKIKTFDIEQYNYAYVHIDNPELYKSILHIGFNKKCKISSYFYLLFLKNNGEIDFNYFKTEIIKMFATNINLALPYIDKVIILHIINKKINSDVELTNSFSNLKSICVDKYIKHIYPISYNNLLFNKNVNLFDITSIINNCVSSKHYVHINTNDYINFIDYIISTHYSNTLDITNILSKEYFYMIEHKMFDINIKDYYENISIISNTDEKINDTNENISAINNNIEMDDNKKLLSHITNIKNTLYTYFILIPNKEIKLLICNTMLKLFTYLEIMTEVPQTTSKIKYYEYGISNDDYNIQYIFYNDQLSNNHDKIKYLKSAADNNHFCAIYDYAIILQKENKKEEASKYFQKILDSNMLESINLYNRYNNCANNIAKYYVYPINHFERQPYSCDKNIIRKRINRLKDNIHSDDFLINRINSNILSEMVKKYFVVYANSIYHLLENFINLNAGNVFNNLEIYKIFDYIYMYFGNGLQTFILTYMSKCKDSDTYNFYLNICNNYQKKKNLYNMYNFDNEDYICKNITEQIYSLYISLIKYKVNKSKSNFHKNAISNYYNGLQKYNNTLTNNASNNITKQEINNSISNLKNIIRK